MCLYEVAMSMYLLGFGMWTMLANFHMCGIILVLKVFFTMLMRKAPNDTAYTWWNCHSGLSYCFANSVDHSCPQQWEPGLPFEWHFCHSIYNFVEKC